jgi:zinc protease
MSSLPKSAAVGLLLLVQGVVSAQSLKVETATLRNGMKVIVNEDYSIPNVALYIFYRVGSRNERPGTTGISHFFEHMMFNGAKKYGPGEFDRVMEAAGGANNAYTSQNVTVYTNWFPSSALELILDLEADRIAHLSFDPKIVESERGVIISERKTSVDANNFGVLSEQLWATAFLAHPYQWPIIGWMSDIEGWKLEDLKNHFLMGYSPSNATMVVVGAVKAETVFELARRHIEPIAAHDPPPQVTTREPEQMGERRIVVRKYAQLPILMLGSHVPETRHADYYPLQLLQTILFYGESSRMYQRLVDKDQLALFVRGYSDLAFDPSLLTITAQPKAGVSLDLLEKTIIEELEKARTDLVSERELEKARNVQLADFYRDLKTIRGKANQLGNYEIFFGSYEKMLTVEDDLKRVTRADLHRVARQYLDPDKLTVATLLPESHAKTGPSQEGR